MSVDRIVVHTTTNCGGCFAVKKRLHEAGIEFKEVEIRDLPTAAINDFIDAGLSEAPIVSVFTAEGVPWDEFAGFQPDKLSAAITYVTGGSPDAA